MLCFYVLAVIPPVNSSAHFSYGPLMGSLRVGLCVHVCLGLEEAGAVYLAGNCLREHQHVDLGKDSGCSEFGACLFRSSCVA